MTERTCGDCSICCKLYDIPELAKPAGAWCSHCAPGHGCDAYDQRPQRCRDFRCLWLLDPTLPDFWKPNRARMIAIAQPETGNIHVTVDPSMPRAWRRAPYAAELRAWSARLAEANIRLIVTVRHDAYLILPDAEVPLGAMSPDHGFRVIRKPGPGQPAYEVVPHAA